MDASMTPATPQTNPASTPMPPPTGGRISRGFRLAGLSWRVVMQEKTLLVLPLISMVASMFLLAGLTGIMWASGTLDTVGNSVSSATSGAGASTVYSQLTIVDYLLLGIYYFLASFIVVFFNAAIVAIAMKRLNGEDASLGDGIRTAWKHVGKIAVWALITATVGLILRTLQERAGFIGQIVIGLIGVAWTIVTFFVVPVLLFEEVGAVGGIKRSASIFKAKWGEQLTGTVAVSLVFMLAGMLGVLIGVGLVFVSPWLGIPFIIFVVVLVAALSGAVMGVFNAALYKFATTGEVGVGFTEADLNAAFYSKKRGRRGATA